MQTEDKFTTIKDALRTINKLDLDKLISSVRARVLSIVPYTELNSSWLLLRLECPVGRKLHPHVFRRCSYSAVSSRMSHLFVMQSKGVILAY